MANSIKSNTSDIQAYVHSPDKRRNLYKRTLTIIIISQMLGGAGLAAGITVGALLAQDMIGTASFAGIPAALFTLGSALAAFLIGRGSQRFGRRIGLGTGFIIGGIGAFGIVMAAIINSIPLLFISLFVYGSGTASNLQARYAGTDLATSKQRATAVSIAMVATTFGAVAGPNLVQPMGNFATLIGIPSLSGPFILAALAYIASGTVLLIFLRPDPLLVAQALATKASELKKEITEEKLPTSVQLNKDQTGVIIGSTVMIIAQIVMVGIMTMTPVYMGKHGFSLAEVGIVIGIHVAAMYLPSLFTGVLVDRLGRPFMVYAAAITLLASGLVAALAPASSFWFIALALALLGLGWNFGLISGTALIIDSTPTETRAKTQGSVDVLIALAGATGGALSGIIVAYSSFPTLSIIGGLMSFLLVPVVLWARRNRRKIST